MKFLFARQTDEEYRIRLGLYFLALANILAARLPGSSRGDRGQHRDFIQRNFMMTNL